MVDRHDRIGRDEGDRLSAHLRDYLERVTEEAREFTRRKPVEGLLFAFLFGLVLGEFLRRDR